MSARGSRGSGTDEAIDVDALVDELFALPLEQFVVARTAASKRIKASGDAVGAERVGRLAKPTVAAWVVNQVARERAEDVEALVRLGDELRDATEDRDRTRIRTLDRLRRERVERVVGELRDAGEVAGRSVSAAALDRVAETLTAAVMDADAGALVRAGRLSQALQHVGFGIVDEGGEPADVVELRARTGAADAAATSEPGGGGRRGKRSSGGDSADDDAAEDAVAAAEREVEESAAEVDRLEAERDDADARVREAGDAVGQVEDELGRVEDELARLADERDTLRARLAEARDAESAAREALDAVDERLDAAEERAAAARKARRAARR